MTGERALDDRATAGVPLEPAIGMRTWIAVGGALIGAFLAVLNIQITNASLPYIEGGIGTGGVYGTWISTAYLIGEIIVIPLTDFFSRVFSLRRYLLANTALFLFFSVLCGHAGSLGEMIVFRALQGFAGGVMIPLAFTIVMTHAAAFETADRARRIRDQRHVRAGDRTDDRRLSHRLLRLALCLLHQPGARPRHAGGARVRAAEGGDAAWLLRQGDWMGIALMAARSRRVSDRARRRQCVQLVRFPLHRRTEPCRRRRACRASSCSNSSIPRPLINFRLLGRRNFGLGALTNMLLGFALYGSAYLLPQYLAVAQGFDPEQIGQVVAWTGLPQLAVIPLVPFLMKRIDARLLVGVGILVFAGSCFMNLYLDQDYAAPQLFWPNVIRALGQAIVMTPISAIAMVGIGPNEAGAASGLFNMMRNLGGAIGTAAIETFFTHREQFHSAMITPQVSLFQPATRDRLAELQQYFISHGFPRSRGRHAPRDHRCRSDDHRPGDDHGLRRQLRTDRRHPARRAYVRRTVAQGHCRKRRSPLADNRAARVPFSNGHSS